MRMMIAGLMAVVAAPSVALAQPTQTSTALGAQVVYVDTDGQRHRVDARDMRREGRAVVITLRRGGEAAQPAPDRDSAARAPLTLLDRNSSPSPD